MTDRQVSVRARFERFPATVKGAFVVRGEDSDPHQVSFRRARVVSVGDGSSRDIHMKEAILDAPPHQDLFLPFEFPISDLSPGWYRFECDVEIDGSAATSTEGPMFVVHWPRSAVRRGSVKIDADVTVGDTRLHLVDLECSGDRATLRFESASPGPFDIRLLADGQALADVESSEESGKGRISTYPVLRSQMQLAVEVSGDRGVKSVTEVEPP